MSMCLFISSGLVSLGGRLLGERRVVNHLFVLAFPQVGVPGSTSEGEDVCNYCHEAGHWKLDCAMLKAKKQHAGGRRVKPAALAASVSGLVDVGVRQRDWRESGLTGVIDESYLPFISNGFISLVGSDIQVPVKILRDTGAFDSYVLESVLCFSAKTDTGDKILVRGMGLDVLPVPVHKMRF